MKKLSKLEIQALIGNFVRMFMHARCLMCVFQSSYAKLDSMNNGFAKIDPIIFDEFFDCHAYVTLGRVLY